MAGYIIRTTDGTTLGSILDGTVDNTSTSLTLIGRNYSDYGQIMTDNLVSLVENFSYNVPPGNPLEGQLWWDAGALLLKVYTGTDFKVVGGATASISAPVTTVAGDIWWNTADDQLYIYNGTTPFNTAGWILVGPSFSKQDGKSGAFREVIEDNTNAFHAVTTIWLDGIRQGIVNDDAEFTPLVALTGFTTIKPGYTMASFGEFNGTADNANSLGGHLASTYLRSDINDATTGSLAVNNDTGITVGVDADLALAVSGNDIILRNNTNNGDIQFTANVGATPTAVLTINGSNGDASALSLNLTDGTVSTSTTTGALVVTGGAGISENLHVGGTITGELTGNVSGTSDTVRSITQVAVGGTGSGTASGARTSLGLKIGTNVQAFDDNIESLRTVGANGILIRTSNGNATARTLAAGLNIAITNGDGIANNPVIALATSPALTGTPTSTTPPSNDNSDRIATTAFVNSIAPTGGQTFWAGDTTIVNAQASFASTIPGTVIVVRWLETYYVGTGNGGVIARFRTRVNAYIKIAASNSWVGF